MIQINNIEQAWHEFVETQTIMNDVPSTIANSWRRSWSRVNIFQGLKIPHLSPEHFISTQIASFDLISIAHPIMEDAYQCVEQSDTVFILVNGAGYILLMLGDRDMLENLKKLSIEPGALLSEEYIGTNAIGIALVEQIPVQVVGAEHFCTELHDLASVAAPIFAPTGRSLGALGLFMPIKHYHLHSLGLVTAIARAVEGQWQADTLLAEQNSQLAQLAAILSSITDGIAVWNKDHRLIQVNPAASKLMERPVQSLMGSQAEQLFSNPPFLAQAIQSNEPLSNAEVNLVLNENVINCFVNLNFVLNKNNELQWGILTLRPGKDVRRLVYNQVGARSVLTLDDIPGTSAQIQHVRNFVRSVADATASILIRGEQGTGKNVLANVIHNVSSRRENPFVIFACSSIPNELIVNELLGYDESVSPNRTGGRPSKFELAQGGSLFFQDVDMLPLEAQAVLLNMLELRIVQRIGSQRPIDVDVRVIASTSANMEKLISNGNFRADLYYRLSMFVITIPPLRERRNDIPLIVDRIINRFSRQIGHPIRLGDGVMDVLRHHPWLGNVREIEATLGRLVIGSTGMIEKKRLLESLQLASQLAADEQTPPALHSLKEAERETILRTARSLSGNVTQMSQILGVSRTTLWRRLKDLQINLDDYR